MLTTLNIHLERWSAWAPGLESENRWREWAENPFELDKEVSYPKVKFLPPMMRRRLSEVGKMALHVAYDCHRDEQLRTVFASRHGEANQTVSILKDIVSNQPVSPTKFSLSVHNTSSGLYTISSENTAPATAIAARLDSFEMGFVEAHGCLASKRESRVMLVYVDAPLKPPFDVLVDYEPPFAGAFILSAGPTENPLLLTLQPREGEEVSSSVHCLSFMQFLLNDDPEPLQFVTDRLKWTWSKPGSPSTSEPDGAR